ncbi:Germin-like protein subfamily 1 member 15 [Heracleum sosnowskyi]|uniref:Germin-like protein subfamily 1 member 15 n=1 Tax=Heracleum sosnowskyi TaxID=360622 RepID=A0AAD8ISS9_9APIA|nr:Germin-like protein subfamily 1 member 15 [Heracleum sosnowskyi]
MICHGSLTDWINHFFDYMGTCFGCCNNTKSITNADEPSKDQAIEGHTVKKTGISDDFWSTSTYDPENSALQSQRSVSSISFSNKSLTGSTSNQSEFVNHGYLRWKQMRLQWTETTSLENQPKKRDPVLSWNATYESLLGTNKRFNKPIPLSEMVGFLVERWEQEGLYD